MNNLVSNFNQTLNFAKEYGLPMTKKRAILREVLQVKVLDFLYRQKASLKLSFIGGTSLRLLKNLDRFSEDLDFDNLGLTANQIDNLIQKTYQSLIRENINLDLYKNVKENKQYYEFRFKDLLCPLKINTDPREKLMTKFDYSSLWKHQKTQVVLLNRYGFVFNLITNDLNQVFVQKLTAYLNRKQTQPRDIYDLVWLKAQGAKMDSEFAKKNGFDPDLKKQAVEKFKKERKKLAGFKRRLRPFLINEENVQKLNFFPQVLIAPSTPIH